MKNKNIVIIMICTFLLVVSILGITYAYFTTNISGSESSATLKARAGEMKINYDGGAYITLSGIYPSDTAWATKNFTVTGKNTTDLVMYYKVRLIVDENTFSNDEIAYSLTATATNNGSLIAPQSDVYINGNNLIEIGTGSFNNTGSTPVIHSYTLYIKYPNKTVAQNVNQGATLKCHLSITDQNYTIASTVNLKNASAAISYENGTGNIHFEESSAMLGNTNENLKYTKSFSVTLNNTSNNNIKYQISLKTNNNSFDGLSYSLDNLSMSDIDNVGNIQSNDILTTKEISGNLNQKVISYNLNFYSDSFGVYDGDLIIEANNIRLPIGYDEIEYIQSSGTQNINTTYYPDDTTVLIMDFINLQTTGGNIVGYYNNNESDSFRFFNASGMCYLDYGSGTGNGLNRIFGSTLSANVRYYLEAGNRYVKNLNTNTNIISSSKVSFTKKSYPIYVNGLDMSLNKWYSLSIKSNNVLVREFVPALRIVDNKPGLYDFVNNIFYINNGTGEFGYKKSDGTIVNPI